MQLFAADFRSHFRIVLWSVLWCHKDVWNASCHLSSSYRTQTMHHPQKKGTHIEHTHHSTSLTSLTSYQSLHVAQNISKCIKFRKTTWSTDDVTMWRCDDWSGLLRHRSVGSAGPAGDDQRGAATSFFSRHRSQRVATGRRRNGSPSQRVAIIVALWWHFLGVIVCGPLANFSDDSAMRICLHLKSNRQMSSSNYSSRFGNRGAQSLLGQADHCGLLSDQHFSAARRQLGSGADSRQSSHAMLRCRQSSWIRRVLEVLKVLPACDANAMHSIWAFSTFSKEMNLQSAWICIQRSIHVYHVSSWRTTVTRSTYINIINIYCHYLPLFAYATYALKFHSAWISAGSSGSWPNEPQRRRSTCVQWKMWKRGWSIYLGGAVTGCG
jgi:hypothetical protein